ncbi:Sporulation related domain-containing protein [Persephonella hydrogeniphila]|uniref:Sporulation related domain-containing protein n=1 Tax=Persephonella hydrogeniphila TaxID=198703 RepID=A0A285NL49_9AQUI|nr:SPOR domain-containing protein [Persephonella hydrogeniphila]SNZ09677.1 Sporulation related domain-containing protein [Persephonella hydrogeniphila]
MRYIIAFFLIFSLAFGLSDKERDTLLRVIQGLYQDKLYNITVKKCQEYLEKTPSDDPYRERIIKILFHSLYNDKNKKDFINYLSYIQSEKISKQTAKEIFALGMKLFKDEPQGKAYVIEFYLPYTEGYEKTQIEKLLVTTYIKAGMWDRILKMSDKKEINIYKVLALYKLGRYKDLINFTEKMSKFSSEDADTVLYYRGLAFFNTGKKDKAAKVIESVTFKTPEMIKFLASYYLKKKDYIKAERYLKLLTLEKEYSDYGYYYLGVIEDLSKNYKKAAEYYKKASAFNTEFGKLAKKRLKQLKEAQVVPVEKFYTVRIILYKTEKEAKRLIQKKKLENCFIKKYKVYYGVFCGEFKDKKDALKERKKLQKLGFKDAVIDIIKR